MKRYEFNLQAELLNWPTCRA